MATYKHVSSKQVIRKILRDLQPASTNFIHDAVEWFGEALEHIGASSQLCTKHAVINISDHRGCLPGDLYYIDSVAVNTCVTPATTETMDEILRQQKALQDDLAVYYAQVTESVTLSGNGTYNSSLTPDDLEDFDSYHSTTLNQLRDINSQLAVLQSQYFPSDGSCMVNLQYGSGTFNHGMHCDECVNEYSSYKATYVVDCGVFKTSFASGQICVSYKAFPLDENCWPMIPDDISYREAMFWYVYKKMLLQGVVFKNTAIGYEAAHGQWLNYCTQARNAANYPDLPRAESFMDQWVRLTPNLNRDITFYQDLNTREEFQRDNY